MSRNPYAAARFEPGEIPWLAREPGLEIETLFERATRPGARHQVIGTHGSGKSTLLRHLEIHALRRGVTVVRARGSTSPSLRGATGLVLLDEYEELSIWQRVALRLPGACLVVSVHADAGFHTLARCESDVRVARHVIEALRGGVPPSDLDTRLARHAGNMREVLFEMYDEVEAATSRGSPSSAPSARDR